MVVNIPMRRFENRIYVSEMIKVILGNILIADIEINDDEIAVKLRTGTDI